MSDTRVSTRAHRARTSGWAALLAAALAAGCANKPEQPEPPPPVTVSGPSQPATGPFQATGWVDSSGKAVPADVELATKTRCAQKIVEASVDQIHVVPPSQIDACLVSMGWKRQPK